jgi:hypothetical protein
MIADRIRDSVPPGFLPPAPVERVILHWTAGGPYPNPMDRLHYHLLVDRDGHLSRGLTPIGRWCPHTRRLNTGSVGIAACGMSGAGPMPFSAGPCPLTEAQVAALCRAAAQVIKRYGLIVTERTCLTHCEVPRVYGIDQRGKWDISWLPGMRLPDRAVAGDRLRRLVKEALSQMASPSGTGANPIGATSPPVSGVG